jgi:HEPN domain-containing protein
MQPDPVLIANTSAWLRKAAQDLARVGHCLAEENPDVEDALFHCQQAAEKALKAFLTWHDQPFRKTHDLAALGKQCAGIDPTLTALAERADELTEYAWAFRYPTNITEPAPGEAEAARTLAQQIVGDIASRLPASVREATERPASK